LGETVPTTSLRASLGGLIAAALVATASPVLLAQPAQAASPAARYGNAAFKATNTQRVEHDRRTFKRNACVQKHARKQARRMARQERMFHQDLGPIIADCNLDRVGENVAYGYPSGRAVVNKGWMKSEGHRANILNREFRLMGVAARKGDDGRWYAAQVFGRRG
jgi:uncharacterized protein YkwD